MSFQELKKRWLAVERAKEEHTRLCRNATSATIEAAGMDLYAARLSLREAQERASQRTLSRLSKFIRSTKIEKANVIAA